MILLDTHIVVWLALSPERISAPATAAIASAESAGETMEISAMTLYEIGNLIRREKISLLMPKGIFFQRIQARFGVIPVSEAIALCASALPAPFHGDPIDRIIAATAIASDRTLITADREIIAAKACRVLW